MFDINNCKDEMNSTISAYIQDVKILGQEEYHQMFLKI